MFIIVFGFHENEKKKKKKKRDVNFFFLTSFYFFNSLLLRSKILQVLKSKTNEPSRIGKAQFVSQGPFKMGERKPKLMNG